MENFRRVTVFDDKKLLVAHIIDTWRKICAKCIAEQGYMTVALSGGRTPIEAYRALARNAQDLPWKKIHIFFVDERFVSLTHQDSNYAMIRETLLDALSMPNKNIHPVDTNVPEPDVAAQRYEEEMIRHFRLLPGEKPRFDLVVLGLGEDGHTASLFPGDQVLCETERLAMAVLLDTTLHDRITLAIPVINNARHVIFLVEGARKAVALRKVVEEQDMALPASLIEPIDGDLLFLADRDAAGLLSGSISAQ